MNLSYDYVFWLSIFGVAFAVVVMVFIGWKVTKMMKADEERHKGQSS